jgi:hypothetical protein
MGYLGRHEPFIFNNFAETIYHAVVLFPCPFDLQLEAGFNDVERVHDEDFGDTSNCPCGELVLERKGYELVFSLLILLGSDTFDFLGGHCGLRLWGIEI